MPKRKERDDDLQQGATCDHTFTWTVSYEDNEGERAIFEATRSDFVIYRLILEANEIATATKGLFQLPRILVKNSEDLLQQGKPHHFLKLETHVVAHAIELKFRAEDFDIEFTLTVPELEMDMMEVTRKRVDRLEKRTETLESLIERVERLERRTFTLAYEATTTSAERSKEVTSWEQTFNDETLVAHDPSGPTILVDGNYQIVVSLAGSSYNSGTYSYVRVGELEMARSYHAHGSKESLLQQAHIIFSCEIKKGQKVAVLSAFYSLQPAKEANRLTIIKLSC
mmetsp:Transcript_11913/g.18113  ORF Transcript_11913/g.18113 Transcript_11913/m.18113 type:complete len:283 (-) Transcript_11913:23-871(-)